MSSGNIRPFQCTRKNSHQSKSARAAASRWTKWWVKCAAFRIANRWHRNTRPCLITVAACNRWPNKDSKSLYLPERLPLQVLASCRVCYSLSIGRRNSRRTVSTSIPKNVTMVAGPSILCTATGTPKVSSTPRIRCRTTVT